MSFDYDCVPEKLEEYPEELSEWGTSKTGCYADPTFITNAFRPEEKKEYVEKYGRILQSLGCSLEVRTNAIDANGKPVSNAIALHIASTGSFLSLDDLRAAIAEKEREFGYRDF